MSDYHSIPVQDSSRAFEAVEKDPVWDLLAKDAKTYPVEESAWFAARTTAIALQTPQKNGFLSKVLTHLSWWIPVPLAGVAALTLLIHTATPNASSSKLSQSSPASVRAGSAEAMFEQHMEMLASSGSSDGSYQ